MTVTAARNLVDGELRALPFADVARRLVAGIAERSEREGDGSDGFSFTLSDAAGWTGTDPADSRLVAAVGRLATGHDHLFDVAYDLARCDGTLVRLSPAEMAEAKLKGGLVDPLDGAWIAGGDDRTSLAFLVPPAAYVVDDAPTEAAVRP